MHSPCRHTVLKEGSFNSNAFALKKCQLCFKKFVLAKK